MTNNLSRLADGCVICKCKDNQLSESDAYMHTCIFSLNAAQLFEFNPQISKNSSHGLILFFYICVLKFVTDCFMRSVLWTVVVLCVCLTNRHTCPRGLISLFLCYLKQQFVSLSPRWMLSLLCQIQNDAFLIKVNSLKKEGREEGLKGGAQYVWNTNVHFQRFFFFLGQMNGRAF